MTGAAVRALFGAALVLYSAYVSLSSLLSPLSSIIYVSVGGLSVPKEREKERERERGRNKENECEAKRERERKGEAGKLGGAAS